jgi:hypothetical protein
LGGMQASSSDHVQEPPRTLIYCNTIADSIR